MAAQTGNGPFTILWDDGFMFIFSFTGADGSTTLNCGFPHQVISVAQQAGTQTQVSPIQQQIIQMQFQVAADPSTWIETIKTAARSATQPTQQAITYDDTISSQYTTTLVSGNPPGPTPGKNFTLQLLYSVTG
ncbi:MAG: hypothetical protein WBR28_09440 [Mycobacterium sp.]